MQFLVLKKQAAKLTCQMSKNQLLLKKKKIVTMGGGSGQFSLLSGLRSTSSAQVTAVVSMADSGGSSGRLREKFGTLPPGDVLKCILALSPDCDYAKKILLRKFKTFS